MTVTVANSLGIGELVTIAGVTANAGNNCTAADVALINGTQIVSNTGLSGAHFEFTVTLPGGATTGTGCTVAGATVTPGSNYLSAPVVDLGGTGNIFVGDSSSNLYEVTPAGVTAASVSAGENRNGGIRDAPIIDSTNAVGFVTTACNAATLGEANPLNAALVQFKFTSTTLTSVAVAGLDTNLNQNCATSGFPVYDPAPDDRYYTLGISSATAANNGEIVAAASGTAGQQIKAFQFTSSVMSTTPEAKPQIGTGASVISPLTEFFNSEVFTVTGVGATAAVVTVTATNTLAANDLITMSGVAANGGTCTAADVAVINGGLYTVASATGAQFTFDATIPSPTAGCTVAGATATGRPDYMFMGVVQNPSEIYTFLLPGGVDTGVATPTAFNTADVAGGTSDMIVDNESPLGQASSIYFGTLATSTTLCGTTAAYCAVKLTQAGLQ
ncbi:MAG: hypothetical protein WAN23_11055 [Candidatus Acidiferrales bacterium]